MKPLLVNTSDSGGGAARAAYRLHRALLAAGVESSMLVSHRSLGDPTITGPAGAAGKAIGMLRPRLGRTALRLLGNGSKDKRSLAFLPSLRAAQLNRSDADVVHLHWVADEMMSIEAIGRITRPLVWTLHDMWAFCGTEHIAWDERYREGYLRSNRPASESGVDLNRLTWNRKRRAWKRPIQIVTPSRWLAECVNRSALMRDWPVAVIPNAIDLQSWTPIDKSTARRLLGIRPEARLVAFGSMGENQARHKGGDLLARALGKVRNEIPDLEVVVFGESGTDGAENQGVPTHYAGVLHDELSLRVVYSAAEALVIPSRVDNLPNTGVEAMACGTPVVAFDTCGLPDIVTHQETGFLARPFEPDDLAQGIRWVLENPERSARLGENARASAQQRFAAPLVAARYQEIYSAARERFREAVG